MPVDVTENEIRVRVRESGRFRRILQIFPTKEDADKEDYPYNDKGIRAVGGPLKEGEGGTKVQAYIFSKDDKYGWTPQKAEDWVRDQGETPKGYSEPADDIMFTYDFEITAVKSFDQVPEEDRIEVPKGVEVVYVEGAASTDEPDRDNPREAIDQKTLMTDEFETNPILLYEHDPNVPVGKVVRLEKEVPLVKDDRDRWQKALPGEKAEALGLWARSAIVGATTKAREVALLARDGLLKGYSIRGKGKRQKRVCHGTKGCWYPVKGLNLVELSVVSVPANQGTLFDVVKSLSHGPGDGVAEDNIEKEEKSMSDKPAAQPPAPAAGVKQEPGAAPPDLPAKVEALEKAQAAIMEKLAALEKMLAEMAGAAPAGEQPPAGEGAEAGASEKKKGQEQPPAAPAAPAAPEIPETEVLELKKSLSLDGKKGENADPIEVEKSKRESRLKLAERLFYASNPR